MRGQREGEQQRDDQPTIVKADLDAEEAAQPDMRPHGFPPSPRRAPSILRTNGSCSRSRGTTGDLPRRLEFARRAEHLLDFRQVHLLAGDHLPCVVFQKHAPSLGEFQQRSIELDPFPLVLEGLLQDLVDVVPVRLQQLSDLQRRMAAQGSDVLARRDCVRDRFLGLLAHPLHDRNASVTEDHQRIVRVADDPRQLQLEDAIEDVDGLLGVHFLRGTRHDALPFARRCTLVRSLFRSIYSSGAPEATASWSALTFDTSNRRAAPVIFSIVVSKSALAPRWKRSGFTLATTNALR